MNNKNKKIIIMTITALVVIFVLIISLNFFIHNKKTLPKYNLTCVRKLDKTHKITYETIFNDEEVDEIIITYTKENMDEDGVYSSSKKQIDYLYGLKGSTCTYLNNDLIITITRKTLDLNKDDKTLSKMFKKYDFLKVYYEKLGYKCS